MAKTMSDKKEKNKSELGDHGLGRGYWVVVADDSQVVVNIISTFCRDRQIGVHAFRNGSEALGFLKKAEPKAVANILAVFAGIDMAKMSGLRLLDEVRRLEHTKLLPFVMLASREERDLVQKAARQGIEGQLMKPLSSEQVYEMIARVCSLATKRVKRSV